MNLSTANKEIWHIRSLAIQKLFPTRPTKKRVDLGDNTTEPHLVFKENATLIEFDADQLKRTEIENIEDIVLIDESMSTWFNLYGLNYPSQFGKIIKQNKLDSFLIHLFSDTSHRTKAVALRDCFFFTAKSIHYSDSESLSLEQMMFVVSPQFIWSTQEKRGDHFDHIRERLEKNVNKVRERGTDYLLFLILESIVDNYYTTYENLTDDDDKLVELNWSNADPNILEKIESRKAHLFRIRKSLFNLKEAIHQIINMEEHVVLDESIKYFSELKEQAGYLIDQIDNDMHRLESSTNLFFSLQSHRLNEVMKTLTILSVIFIPLTFIAGIYGMNFENMPELKMKYAYFGVLAVMLTIVLTSVIYFKRKKWF
jgi:magnesium transporter